MNDTHYIVFRQDGEFCAPTHRGHEIAPPALFASEQTRGSQFLNLVSWAIAAPVGRAAAPPGVYVERPKRANQWPNNTAYRRFGSPCSAY